MEMAEAANILRRSTRRSLLLIDEVGRGTGTLDGLSIAQAICEFLLGLERPGADGALRDALPRAVRAGRALGAGRQLSHHRGREHGARRGAGLLAPRPARQLVAFVRHRGRADGRPARGRRRAGARDCRRALRATPTWKKPPRASAGWPSPSGRAANSRSWSFTLAYGEHPHGRTLYGRPLGRLNVAGKSLVTCSFP